MWLIPHRLSLVRIQWHRARNVWTRGEVGVMLVVKTFARVCARNYSGMKFILPSQSPIPSPSPASGYAGVWEGELWRWCGNTTLWPRLKSRSWTNHVCVKWVPCFFPPWVDSKSWVRLEPPFWACYTQRGQTEKNVFVDRGSAYHDYPYFDSTNDQGAYPLAHTCRYPCQRLKIRRWWWHHSRFFHKPRTRTSTLVSNPPLPWLTPPSDLLRTWWMRGSLRT